jgi:hypothetical protein
MILTVQESSCTSGTFSINSSDSLSINFLSVPLAPFVSQVPTSVMYVDSQENMICFDDYHTDGRLLNRFIFNKEIPESSPIATVTKTKEIPLQHEILELFCEAQETYSQDVESELLDSLTMKYILYPTT